MSRSLNVIMTVNGPVAPDRLGFTLPHEHLLNDLYRVSRNFDAKLDDEDLAARELEAFRRAGGGALVELTNPDAGRQPEALRRLSSRSGVNIIMGCGWYHSAYYPERLDRTSTDTLAHELIAEIEGGVGAEGVRPGIIGEIGADQDFLTGTEERVLRAAARAHEDTGLTVTTHAVFSPVGLQQVELLREEGVAPNRVIVGHCDSHPDRDYHRALLEMGAWIEFDRISGRHEYERDMRIGLILAVRDAGRLDQLLLSSDVCTKSDLLAYGGTGYGYIPGVFRKELHRAGLRESEVRLLLDENPLRALTGM